MRFDTKIAIVVRTDLAVWQKLNVTAFVASAVTEVPDPVIGRPYVDGSGTTYLPMFRQPVLIFAGDADELTTVHGRALARRDSGIRLAIYTEELFATGHDDDNRAAVAAVPTEKLRLVGLGLYGPRNAVDRCVKGLSLHA